MRQRPVRCGLPLLLAVISATAAAQPTMGIGADASSLRHGVVRVSIGNQWQAFDQRFANGLTGTPAGELEPLGAPFTLDALGVAHFPRLAPVEAALRTLTGRPAFTLSLGATRTRIDATTTVTPMMLELGLFDRLTLGVLVPFVRARREVAFDIHRMAGADVLGLNPVLGGSDAATLNTTLVNQLRDAAQSLESRVAACEANPASSPDCPAVRANGPALVAMARSFADAVIVVYGRTASEGSRFVPTSESPAQQHVRGRVADLRSQFGAFGIGTITVDGPAGAPAQLVASDVMSLITDPANGIAAGPLAPTLRQFIGDVELGAKFVLIDGFGRSAQGPSGLALRLALGALYRFGTGRPERVDDFTAAATGDGQDDVEVSALFDIAISQRFWFSGVGRYGVQFSDQRLLRVPEEPGAIFPPAWSRQLVDRDLGDYLVIEASPRARLSDALSIHAHYFYRHDAADEYAGTFFVDSAVTGTGDVTLDASVLGVRTSGRQHRIGGGISYSSVAAFERGTAPFPIEVSYQHFQTIGGDGGVPKLTVDDVRLRIFWPLFGRRR